MSKFDLGAGGRYGMHSGSARFKNAEIDGALLAKGSFVYGVAGDVWYVDCDVSAGGNGKTPQHAFKTVEAAIAVAAADDTILIFPGSYTPTAAITITQNNLRILGCPLMGSLQGGGADITAATATDLFTINAHHVEIAGLTLVGVSTNDIIVTGSAKFGIHIHDCRFDTGAYGVDANNEAPNVLVENCYFQSCSTAAIRLNSTRSLVRGCIIKVPASGIGIDYVPTTGNRPGIGMFDNYIFGGGSGDTGIKITGSPTMGEFAMINNRISGCATSITGAKDKDHGCMNYDADTAGGALIDLGN